LLFLAGAFSMTQVKLIGYIGITELFFFALAPIVFFRNRRLLISHGFRTVLYLVVLWGGSALVTDWIRGNTIENLLKGVAVPYAIFSGIVCLHALLWDDVERFKWAVVGFSVSVLLSTYVLPYGTSASVAQEQGVDAVSAAKGYKLYAVMMANAFLLLPVQTLYLKLPQFLNVGLTTFVSLFSLLEGGRSAFLVKFSSVWVMWIGGKKAASMRRIARNYFPILLSLLIVGGGAAAVYKVLVTKGYMGETEFEKYEEQSESRIGLLSGRIEFLPALMAIRDSPLIGHGSWPLDVKGYSLRAQELVGGDEALKKAESNYYRGMFRWIPCHSYVWQAWVWHGLLGGVFWIYVFFFVFVKTFLRYLSVFPALFGYLAIQLPSEFWNVWFSPLGQRVEKAMLITLCLLCAYYYKNPILKKRMDRSAHGLKFEDRPHVNAFLHVMRQKT
jgi:hypothetical protein